MSNAVIKPAAWLRSNPALQSAKNNVRRVPGSDGDSLHRLRWRPGTGAQRYSLALLACCGRTSRSGAASAAGERGARPGRQDSRTPGLSPAAVRHRAAVSKQPFRHRELARPTARVCTLTGAARSLGLHQVAAKGDWGSGCTRAGRLLGPKGWRSAKVGRGGAVGSGRASSGCGAASECSACPGTRSARLPCP